MLNASSFATELIARAQKSLADDDGRVDTQSVGEGDEEEDESEGFDAALARLQDEPEADIEDLVSEARAQGGPVEVSIDEDKADPDPTVSYPDVAMEFMNTLLTNTLSVHKT